MFIIKELLQSVPFQLELGVLLALTLKGFNYPMPNNLDNQPVFLYRRGAARIQPRCQFEDVCVFVVPRLFLVCVFLCVLLREN